MGLFIPTSGSSYNRLDNAVVKGYLYNLDLGERLTFQFNPEQLSWENDVNWEEINHFGDDAGGDLHFINRGRVEMPLPLLYIADPGAPAIEFAVDNSGAPNLPDSNAGVDFEFIEQTIRRWGQKIPGKGRPAAVAVFLGEFRSLYGVITHVSHRVDAWFEDLSVREGLITLELKEWPLAKQLA